MPALVQIIAEISEMPSTTRRVGAPRQKQTRAALLAAIYCLRRGSRQPSIREFSGEIARVLKIKYARTIGTGGPNWKEQSVAAIEQDLRRGLAPENEKLVMDMMQGLIWWRYTCVNTALAHFADPYRSAQI